MEAHNAHTHLVQPNFSPGDYVLRAEPKRFQHKLTLVWKGPYQVDKVFDNHTIRVNSLINGAQFITHVTRTRFYQEAMLQTAEDLQATAHFNNTVEFFIDKFGPLSKDKMTGEICVLTSWHGFDWRPPDSIQRCRRELGCDQMMILTSLIMLLAVMGYKRFKTTRL
jgi:hypothetical protein